MNDTITITCHYDQSELTLEKSCYICSNLYNCSMDYYTVIKKYQYDDNDEFCKTMFKPESQSCATGKTYKQCHYYNHGCNKCEGNKNE